MPESLERAAHRRFETRPPPQYVSEIQKIIGQTAAPELCDDLHKGPISNREPFQILAPVSIARGRREDGSKAPCPMCSPNKFYEGKLVYFPRLKSVAVIGHCCAASDVRQEAEAQYRREQALERAQDFLVTEVPKSASRVAELKSALPVAEEAQRVFGQMKSRAGYYVNLLRRATKGSGRLGVDEVVERRGDGPRGLRAAGSTYDTRTIDIGEVRGRIAFATKFMPADELAAVVEVFLRYAAHDEGDALEKVVTMREEDRIDAESSLAGAISRFEKVLADLTEFRLFFDPENVRRINEWGSHPSAQYRISIDCRRRHRIANRVVIDLAGGPRGAGIVIEDALWLPLPAAAGSASYR